MFLNGTDDDTDLGSLGLLDQPTTFLNSLVGEGGFLSGPIAPNGIAPDDPESRSALSHAY